jgi:hypothetical protein
VVCECQYSPLAHLVGSLLLSHDPQQTWVAVVNEVTAYFDDSGHPDDQAAVVIAGWVATLEQWILLESGWKQALSDANLTSFHMTDFESNSREYCHLNSKEKARLLDRLISHIVTRTRYSFCFIVPMSVYRVINDAFYLEELLGKPYALAGQLIVEGLMKWKRRYAENCPLVSVFDDGSKHKGDLLDMFKQQQFDLPAFRNKKSVVSLQAADMLAWECFNSFQLDGLERESLALLRRVPFEHGKVTETGMVHTMEVMSVPRRDADPNLKVTLEQLPKKNRTRQIMSTPLQREKAL